MARLSRLWPMGYAMRHTLVGETPVELLPAAHLY